MFTLEFLQAVNDWQRGGNPRMKAKRGKRLKKLAAGIDAKFARADLVCFRRLALDSHYLWKLGDTLYLTETISAWTFDSDVARGFKGGVPPSGEQGIIFEIIPKPEQVIINLAALYRDSAFQEACEAARDRIRDFGKGIGKYGNTQSEVVLEVETVPVDAVYALGGYSSSRDDIARMFFGREPTEADMAIFNRLLEQSGRSLGPQWLTGEAKDRVLLKLLASVERLRPYHPDYM